MPVNIYTRTGDAGLTSLGNGARVSKAARRVDAYGTVDELNSVLGVLLAEELPTEVREDLVEVQSLLLDCGSFLAAPGGRWKLPDRVTDPSWLERFIDAMDAELPRLSNFVLPAGSRAAALAHQARTVCRRAERAVVLATEADADVAQVVPFLNRLSDTLFTVARLLNLRAGVGDVCWRRR
jgi:cob(I)alamin adenosyltransferase